MPALSHMEAHQIARDLGCLMSSRELVASANFLPADSEPVNRSLLASIATFWMRRRTVRELRRLPDNVLRDIGIERDRIEDVASELTLAQRQRTPLKA